MIGWAGKALAIIIILGLLMSYFPQIFGLVIICAVLWFSIRWLADVYWDMKDNER